MTSHHARSTEPEAPRGLLAFLFRWLFDFRFERGYAARLDYAIAVLIILSVLALIAEHVQLLPTAYLRWFDLFDALTVGVFTLEYLLRLATAPLSPEFARSRYPRLRYVFSFYALVDLLAIVPFYLAGFMAGDLEAARALRLLRLMRIFKLSRHLVPAWQEFMALNRHHDLRGKIHALIEPTGHSGKLHAYVDNFIIFWVLLSIVCVVLESVESVHRVLEFEFKVIDAMAFTVFIVEYAARLYVAPERPEFRHLRWRRWAHLRSPAAIIDMLAILPYVLTVLFPNELDLRVLRVFRLMRLLKLTRYTSATVTLYKVVRREWQVILAAVFVMLLLVVLTASMGYLFEHDAQPDKFENIPQSIYWAVVTLASVGYGDISPVTPMGRALTVVLSLIGIGIFAIPAGLLASAFTDQLRIDREEFKRRLLHAYEGGTISPHARALIAAETDRLHLSAEDVRRLTQEAKEAVEARKQELHSGGQALLIDPRGQPELAMKQLRLLASQLQLLSAAAGNAALQAQIRENDGDAELLRRLLQALETADSAAHPASGLPADRSAGPSR